jgi:hypothetical protein
MPGKSSPLVVSNSHVAGITHYIIRMRRPVGVTASAIVAFLGSTLAIIVAPVVVAAVFFQPPQASQASAPPAAPMLLSGLMFAVLGGVGIWTAVDLFRLRSWARTSMLVFAGFIGVGSLFTMLMFMVVPMPADISAETLRNFRTTMVIGMAVPVVIAGWWLIQFNTPSTKAAFASTETGTISARPMSITIIAILMIVAGAWFLVAAFMPGPGFVFGIVLSNRAASIVYALIAVVSIYTGKGLLDLREPTRLIAIGWHAFWFLHAAVITLVPALRQRMLKLPHAVAQDPRTPMPDPSMLINLSLLLATITAAFSIWFLVRHRDAFVRHD